MSGIGEAGLYGSGDLGRSCRRGLVGGDEDELVGGEAAARIGVIFLRFVFLGGGLGGVLLRSLLRRRSMSSAS